MFPPGDALAHTVKRALAELAVDLFDGAAIGILRGVVFNLNQEVGARDSDFDSCSVGWTRFSAVGNQHLCLVQTAMLTEREEKLFDLSFQRG
ncbi:MAG: hypothetical protein SynsKO_01220 [Synoicihabitans sp.]